MKAVIIDDEYPSINEIRYLLKNKGAEITGSFIDPREGYDFIAKEKPDAVFLDIDMPYISGLELGLKIQENFPDIIIVFVTAYPQYALDAFKVYPIDYILKPIDESRFAQTVAYIEKRISGIKKKDRLKPYVKCFGKFEILQCNVPVKFQTQKTRELFAYLICNIDSIVYKDEIINIIFKTGDIKRDTNNFRVTLFRLRSILRDAFYSEDIIHINENCSLNIKKGFCDYTDFILFFNNNKAIDHNNIRESMTVIEMINGEFMSDIDTVWATEVREKLLVQSEELMVKTALFLINSENSFMIAENILLKLISCNPLSEQGYLSLLDLFIKTGDTVKYNYYYRHYEKMLKDELRIKPEKKYLGFFNNIKK